MAHYSYILCKGKKMCLVLWKLDINLHLRKWLAGFQRINPFIKDINFKIRF